MFQRLIILLVLLETGCGTLAGRERHVSVDSSPRGAKVVDGKGKPLGVTPFFLKAKSASAWKMSSEARFKAGNIQTIDCSYAFWGSMIENSPLGIIGAAIAGGWGLLGALGGSMGVDALTGTAFLCPDSVQIKLDEQSESLRYCPRFHVLAPKKLKPKDRQAVRSFFIDMEKSKDGCAEEVNTEAGSTWLRRLDVDLSDSRRFRRERRRLFRLGSESGASHITQLNLLGDKGSERIGVRTVDLHTFKIVRDDTMDLPKTVDRQSLYDGAFTRSLAKFLLDWIPDSIALGWNERTVTVALPDDTQETPSAAGSPSVKLMSLSHPDAYSSWAVVPRITPGVGFDLFQGLGRGGNDNNEFSRLSLTGMGSLTWHTPMGAFEAGLGAGYGFYFHEGSNFSSKTSKGSEFLFHFNYTAFMTDSVFFRLYVDVYRPSEEVGDGLIRNVLDTGLVVGYSFDLIDRWMWSWL